MGRLHTDTTSGLCNASYTFNAHHSPNTGRCVVGATCVHTCARVELQADSKIYLRLQVNCRQVGNRPKGSCVLFN